VSVRVTWVVVADPRQATIYGVTRGMARLREIETLEAVFGADGNGREPQAAEAEFALEIGRYLEAARRGGRLHALVLVASPAFLVPLRAALSRALRAALVGEIDCSRLDTAGDALQLEVLKIL